MSSGSETRRRVGFVRARCTPEESAEIEQSAVDAGFASVGEFIRARCLRKTRAPQRLRPEERRELGAVLGQLGKWGSNLNQLAYQAHLGDSVSRADFEELASQVREVSAAVMGALGRGHQG